MHRAGRFGTISRLYLLYRIRQQQSDRGDITYLYDGTSVIEERSNSSLLAHYRYAGKLLALSTPQGNQYYHLDALGSTTELTDDQGDIKASYHLDPWGSIEDTTGDSINRRIFTGKETDQNTGLINIGVRYYDPETARFITQDTYLGKQDEPPSLHRYLYAYSNPTVYVDLEGYAACMGQKLDNCPAENFIPDKHDAPLMVDKKAWKEPGYLSPVVKDLLPQNTVPTVASQHIYTENYKYVPHVYNQKGSGVAYYDVIDQASGRSRYTINPNEFKDFVSNEKILRAGANSFYGFTGNVRESEIENQRAQYELMHRGNIGQGLKHFAQSWGSALKEPETYIQGAMAFGAALKTVPATTVENGAGKNVATVAKNGGMNDIVRRRAELRTMDTSEFTNMQKGKLGEARAALTYQRAGYEQLSAKLPSDNGFDGVFVKYGADGNPMRIFINESKFSSTGRASLSNTNMGKQMSPRWVNENIQKMLLSGDADVAATGRFLRNNSELIRTKANVLNPQGANRWNVLKLPE